MPFERLQETILFHGTREGLTKAFGVSSLEELRASSEVTLNAEIFQEVSQAVNSTLRDGRERSITFTTRQSRLVTFAKHIGTALDNSKESATAETLWVFNALFGKSKTLYFHTHPSFTLEEMRQSRIRETRSNTENRDTRTSKSFKSLPVLTAKSMQLYEPNFSEEDLTAARSFPRHGSAFLLGTEHGYRLIVNPNFRVPIRRGKTPQIKEYGRNYKSIVDEEISRVTTSPTEELDLDMRLGSLLQTASIKQSGEEQLTLIYGLLDKLASKFYDIDYNGVRAKVDDLLKKVCEEQGWLLFGNDDYDSPKLQRLN